MTNWKNNLNLSKFSHIYVEDRVLQHENTKIILSKLKNSKIIRIKHYKDVFCRHNQTFSVQKRSAKLILAYNDGNLIYEGAKVCDDFGNKYFYYTSSIMNCVYNCEYCYLQGMYSSANIVVFVNIEDVFYQVSCILKKHPAYICISYDTDMMALEGITGFLKKWMKFVGENDNLKIEVRTKSSNFKSIENIKPMDNVILAWTISPNEIVRNYEAGTPELDSRLKSAKNALDNGWRVRICFDPILYVENWDKYYKKCIEETFRVIPANKIQDVSIGVFRVSKNYFKNMVRLNPRSLLLAYPFEIQDGVCTYSEMHHRKMTNFVYSIVSNYVDRNKIFVQ
ncbi:SPL family radical SAM protein [Clostridium sp. HV4-5-A1G]|uniref:SPL family radical SAM protein n=1 Tax=Clostridium sp. HV4-5-A1G TaxID=2004595 RepID=UPI00123AE51D|nr:radical SAM protein [Clostridium sp. HV4-5-A1G]KAA8676337.1 radical SAM protein [Clostridium sp. HV4-5-A1G]